jgi:hypothetical protein
MLYLKPFGILCSIRHVLELVRALTCSTRVKRVILGIMLTSCGRSVGIVRLRIKAVELYWLVILLLFRETFRRLHSVLICHHSNKPYI